MRRGCWISLHACNTFVTLILWISALAIVFSELHFEKQLHARTSYKTIEEALMTTISAVLFATFRLAQGYCSRHVILAQMYNPLMQRSATSQIVFVVYCITSLLATYFSLVNHADLERTHTPDACFALQWIMLVLMLNNHILAIEQFSHPELVQWCGVDPESHVSRGRRLDDDDGGGGTPLRKPTEARFEIGELEDIDDVSDDE